MEEFSYKQASVIYLRLLNNDSFHYVIKNEESQYPSSWVWSSLGGVLGWKDMSPHHRG